MVKAYLRYELADAWGVITSKSSVCYDRLGKFFFTSSLERVSVWDIKQAVLVRSFIPPLSISGKPSKEVTCIVASPTANHIAVGYGDGMIRIWSTDSWDCECTFNGHKTAVTALRFSSNGSLLASGSQDSAIILWDVSGETGLFRLSGHRGQITDVAFLSTPQQNSSATGANGQRLVSCSKDEIIKVWDLGTQHCCQTIPCRGGEVWSIDVDHGCTRVAVGSTDGDVRLYTVHIDAPELILTEMGSIRRSISSERVATLRYGRSPDGSALLFCQGAGKVVDIWRVRSHSEALKRLKRRKKRRKEKGRSSGNEEGEQEPEETLSAVDELELVATIRCKHKVSFSALAPVSSRKLPSRMVLSLANNSLEVWEFKINPEDEGDEDDEKKKSGEGVHQKGLATTKVASIDGPGHRSDIRALALSSDDSLCLSTSNTGVKVWNPRSGTCLQSIHETGYGLCALFVPGNKHAIIGTKEGTIDIIDIAASTLIESVKAHNGPVWSVAALPDGSGFVSGSADKEVKFWEWDLKIPNDDEDDENNDEKKSKSKKKRKKKETEQNERKPSRPPQLGIAHSRTLTMTDDVLCVRVSPDGKLIAISLLDSTVKVFFTESLKFFLSLYGHKLPVLSMDISSDGTLLATGSADKNLKIWGLDFGDCHRSLFAHQDSVMAVHFVPRTHYIFTAGKDSVIKYWDADKFEELLELKGHSGEVWALAVSSLGDFVVSGSHDRGLRRWERTEEPFFIEEEKEKRLESLFEEDLGKQDDRTLVLGPDGGAMEENEVAPAGKKSLETVSAADSIVEALDMAANEEERIKEVSHGGSIQPNPLLLGLSPSDYVMKSLSNVRSSELEQAILLLSFTDTMRLLGYLVGWLKRGSKVELLCRVATLLLRVHMQQLMATASARPILTELQGLLRGRVQQVKDTMGYNLAAIEHIKRALEERGGVASGTAAVTAILPLKRRSPNV